MTTQNTPHPNAKLAIEYWTRAAEDDQEWKNWEYKSFTTGAWEKVQGYPSFYPGVEFRRIKKQKYIRIGDVDVPAPEREAPAVGTPYFNLRYQFEDEYGWMGSEFDFKLLNSGVVHLTAENAKLHWDAITKLSDQEPFEKGDL